jgi:hypothetical protein
MNGLTRTPRPAGDGIRCLGGESIPCRPVTPAVSQFHDHECEVIRCLSKYGLTIGMRFDAAGPRGARTHGLYHWATMISCSSKGVTINLPHHTPRQQDMQSVVLMTTLWQTGWSQFFYRQISLCSNILSSTAYGVDISQLIVYAKSAIFQFEAIFWHTSCCQRGFYSLVYRQLSQRSTCSMPI